MEPKRTAALAVLSLALLVLFPGPAVADNKYTYAPNPQKEIYFGHISFAEISGDSFDPLIYRQSGPAPEKAVLNFPLGPGDTVQTSAQRDPRAGPDLCHVQALQPARDFSGGHR